MLEINKPPGGLIEDLWVIVYVVHSFDVVCWGQLFLWLSPEMHLQIKTPHGGGGGGGGVGKRYLCKEVEILQQQSRFISGVAIEFQQRERIVPRTSKVSYMLIIVNSGCGGSVVWRLNWKRSWISFF